MGTRSPPDAHSLLIVGAGALGRAIAAQWLEAHPNARVVGETLTPSSHATLFSLGITPALVGGGGAGFARAVFCAPPGETSDYPASVAAAAARVAPGGVFVFTGSASVYRPGVDVNEDSPVRDDEGGRPAALLGAERAALSRPEGRIVRLSGLYSAERTVPFFLRALSGPGGIVPGSADGHVNFVHYEDAAAMVVAVLERGEVGAGKDSRRLFFGTDGCPMTRRNICEAARRYYNFDPRVEPMYMPMGPATSKKYSNAASRKELSWQPRWESIAAFMRADAEKRSKVMA